MRTASLSVCVTFLAAAASADCNCGPDFCQGDPRYPLLLDTKKQALRADGYPEALVSLLDRGGACGRVSEVVEIGWRRNLRVN